MKKILKIFTALILTISFYSVSNVNYKVQAENKSTTVPIELWHSENSGRLSMGSKALSPTATVVENEDGTATITIKFVPMDFMNKHGHLIGLSIYQQPLFSGNLTKAEVVSTYEDTNLSGGKSSFPGELKFNYSEKKPDKIGVSVTVDAMNEIMGGDASQNAILKFNWNGESKGNSEQKNENTSSDNTPQANFTTKKLEDYFKDNNITKNIGLYNIDVTASYLNPLTGITADGGTKNAAIGEGMSQGVISPVNAAGNINDAMSNQKTSGEKRWSKALLQRTSDGKLYATIRIHLMNWVQRSKEQGPFIKVLQKNGEFKLVEATETKVNIKQYEDSYVDYRFEVPNENFLTMVQMFVEPMNRPVRFFVEVNTATLTKENTTDMAPIVEKNYKSYFIFGGLALIVLAGGIAIFSKKRKSSN